MEADKNAEYNLLSINVGLLIPLNVGTQLFIDISDY